MKNMYVCEAQQAGGRNQRDEKYSPPPRRRQGFMVTQLHTGFYSTVITCVITKISSNVNECLFSSVPSLSETGLHFLTEYLHARLLNL